MIGTTNISKGSSSGSTLKVLNVVQNGSLSRIGDKVSDFSGTNYLTFAQRISQGYINLDNSQYNFNLAKYLSTAYLDKSYIEINGEIAWKGVELWK